MLSLERPLVILDIESTGLDTDNDRIVQLAMLRVEPGKDTVTYNQLFNPGIPIPAEAADVHGIHSEDVQNCPMLDKAEADKIVQFIGDADLGGHNIRRFDLPFLASALARVGAVAPFDVDRVNVVDTQEIFVAQVPHTLAGAALHYLGEVFEEDAHDALADCKMSLQVLHAQAASHRWGQDHNSLAPITPAMLERAVCPERDSFVDLAGKLIRRDDGVVYFNFGKHAGHPVADTPIDFRAWVLSSDFTDAVKGHMMAQWLDSDHKLIWDDVAGEPAIAFGKKHSGKHFSEVPADYLDWMTRADFSDEVKDAIKAWRLNR